MAERLKVGAPKSLGKSFSQCRIKRASTAVIHNGSFMTEAFPKKDDETYEDLDILSVDDSIGDTTFSSTSHENEQLSASSPIDVIGCVEDPHFLAESSKVCGQDVPSTVDCSSVSSRTVNLPSQFSVGYSEEQDSTSTIVVTDRADNPQHIGSGTIKLSSENNIQDTASATDVSDGDNIIVDQVCANKSLEFDRDERAQSESNTDVRGQANDTALQGVQGRASDAALQGIQTTDIAHTVQQEDQSVEHLRGLVSGDTTPVQDDCEVITGSSQLCSLQEVAAFFSMPVSSMANPVENTSNVTESLHVLNAIQNANGVIELVDSDGR